MPYLYGDSTPFPLDEDFIDTIQHLINAGVEMLAQQDKIDQGRRDSATTVSAASL